MIKRILSIFSKEFKICDLCQQKEHSLPDYIQKITDYMTSYWSIKTPKYKVITFSNRTYGMYYTSNKMFYLFNRCDGINTYGNYYFAAPDGEIPAFPICHLSANQIEQKIDKYLLLQ